MKTVFEILGVEDKELQVSNLLAYYFNPNHNGQYALEFLNDFCEIAGLDSLPDNIHVEVIREDPIVDNFNGKEYRNFIDIIIKITEAKSNGRIICIENKIYSEEGHKQTERYFKAVENKYSGWGKREYVYLTKNNSYVDLTASEFKHLRYSELANILSKSTLSQMVFAKDFCEYYVLREERMFENIESSDKTFADIDEKKFNEFIDYVVWKVNNHKNSEMYGKIFCKNGKSAQSADCFYQISHQDWEQVINVKFAETVPMAEDKVDRDYTLHIEGKRNAVFLHFELNPYLPVSKIEKQYGKTFLAEYQNKRNLIEKLLSNVTVNGAIVKNIPSNASLTVGKWEITAKSYNEYFSVLMALTQGILEKVKML